MKYIPPVNNIYISFDPGRTTGVCIATTTVKDFQLHELGIIESESIPWGSRFGALQSYMGRYDYNFCIVEDFRLYRAKAKDQINSRFPSSQLIGIIEYLCFKNKIPIKFQMASERKRVKVEERYHEKLGGMTRNGRPKSQHRYDAFQHLRLFAVTKAQDIWTNHMRMYEEL